ncbi:energy-coupling factor transporter ATP-binding protein EcfA2 [Variovorax sp. SG517]|uniref:hypothetical protein n=1 Tax=Variovorax sp. SG517 TaxID=2587117 RepID=UPI00159D9082|nr:hypothetical protein [Variovorax sp. SG517]NVM91932.1 energy-coupling factor transporter ATP-binding protein EcfA2 [Variovorax sp. SG517]
MTATLISSIRVSDLFGLYSYRLPSQGELSNAAILYGDNGMGKSTLLRLAFHLLSAANNRGHRSALYQAEFKILEVTLTSGTTLLAKFTGDPLVGKTLVLSILRNNRTQIIWEYRPGASSRFASDVDTTVFISHDGKLVRREVTKKRGAEDSIKRGEQEYLKSLDALAPTLFILNADRRLDSDSVSDPSDEMELRRVMRYDEPKRINELVVRSREIALSQALGSAARWIGRKAVLGANQGSMNVHSVYVDVLHHLLSPSSDQDTPISADATATLQKQLVNIETKTAEHARYELATQLSTSEFRKALGGRSKKRAPSPRNSLSHM